MAFNFGNDEEVISEINVTPLVDVMLVLLVIFMISAPLMFNGVNVKLPKTKKIQNVSLKSSQIILSIKKTGEFYLDDQKILRSELITILMQLMKEKSTETVFIRADHRVSYGEVAKAMAYLKGSGITQVSLVTELEAN